MEKERPFSRLWNTLTAGFDRYNDYEYPKVSVIIPTYNCSQNIVHTLESVIAQHYPDFEIVIVDAGSTDRTLEIIKSFHSDNISIYSVSANRRYEMLNKGISQSKGSYLSILFPGDYYLSFNTLKIMMSTALEHEKPHLLFCGTLLRDGKTDPKTLLRPLNFELLSHGKQPTSLQSCWLKSDLFHTVGKFNTHYELRGGFDLLCRIYKTKSLRFISSKKIFVDYDLRSITRSMILRHFWETGLIIFRNFGLLVTLRWLVTQRDSSRFFRSWFRSVKIALTGR